MRERLLDELRYEYREGRLVPFLGSGMSLKVCRGWADMIAELERIGGIRPAPERVKASEQDDFELTRRAAWVLERLRLEGGMDHVVNAVRDALVRSGPALPPSSTAALARLDWPLVLTTNYDDLYVAAVHAEFLGTRRGKRPRTSENERRTLPLEIVGRSPSDCHRVLSALRWPAHPLMWALQGFLPGQALIVPPPDIQHGAQQPKPWLDYVPSGDERSGFSSKKREELERQLVVGHAEYRAVAMRSETFRRAFAEVFRSRSLLFLGSGLHDRYLLDLFSQIAELYGPSSQQHYAVLQRREVDSGFAAFMQRYFGIRIVEVDDYDKEIPVLLETIGSSTGRSAGAIRWGYVKRAPRKNAPSLSIVSSPLTPDSASSGCVVVSGGGSEDWPRLNSGIRVFLAGNGLLPERFRNSSDDRHDKEEVGRLFRRCESTHFIWRLKEEVVQQVPNDRTTLLVARVRLDPASKCGRQIRPLARPANKAGTGDSAGRLWRDLRLVKPAMREALDIAAAAGHRTVVSTLLATGDLRAFPPSFALQEMVRAWVCDTATQMSLEIRMTDETVLTDMRSGRLDLAYLFSRFASTPEGASSMRFWLEIAEGNDRTQRLLELREFACPVRDFLKDHWLGRGRWLIDVWPAPCIDWVPWTLGDVEEWERKTGETMSLERFGVLHGSTLRVYEV
jgi:hypothetical protein